MSRPASRTEIRAGRRTAVLALVVVCISSLLPGSLTAPAGASGSAAGAAGAATQSSGSDPCTGSVTTPPIEDSFLLPPWSDGAGWTNPSQFETILAGDIDGDGVGELVGRNGSSVEIWTWAPNYAGSAAVDPPVGAGKRYDPSPGQWAQVVPTGDGPTFAEADGWWDPARYETFQLADVLGAGSDQLVVREADGVVIYRFDPSTNTWGLPGSAAAPLAGPTWLDRNGPFDAQWGQNYPQHYKTIMTGDADGDGRDEIVGLGPFGAETWGYDPDTGLVVQENETVGNLPPGIYANESSYLSMRMGVFEGNRNDEGIAREQIVVLDPDLGMQLYGYVDGISGLGWYEDPVPGSNNWTAANGWSDPSSYTTLVVADVDGDGRDDVTGRSPNGLDTWTYRTELGVWQEISAPPTDPSRSVLTNADGYDRFANYASIQPADLSDAAALEIIARGPAGVAAYRLESGSWQPTGQLLSQFSDANGWNDPAVDGTPNSIAPGYRSATIHAVTAQDGQAQLVIGRDVTGVRTYRMDGTAPTTPFPAYTNLDGIPNVLPGSPGSASPQLVEDLKDLTPEGRAYWYVNAVAMRQIWPGSSTSETILHKYRTSAVDNLSTLHAALLGALSSSPPTDPTVIAFEPAESNLAALNVDRTTYNEVVQDVADWTGAVVTLNDLFLGSQGMKQLIRDSFVVNANYVEVVKPAFSTSGKWLAFMNTLVGGVIAGIGSVTAFFPAEGYVTAKFLVPMLASTIGAGTAGSLGFLNPNGKVDTEASELEADMRNTFCSAGLFVDQSYDQIVQDYGLLTATRQMANQQSFLATNYDAVRNTLTRRQQIWVWQQFANRPGADDNWWVGICDRTKGGCQEWPNGYTGVWVSPENPNVVYRLVGQRDGGDKPHCGYSVEDSSKNKEFTKLGVSPAEWAAPRETDGDNLGYPLHASVFIVPYMPNYLEGWRNGINGWSLGVGGCQ